MVREVSSGGHRGDPRRRYRANPSSRITGAGGCSFRNDQLVAGVEGVCRHGPPFPGDRSRGSRFRDRTAPSKRAGRPGTATNDPHRWDLEGWPHPSMPFRMTWPSDCSLKRFVSAELVSQTNLLLQRILCGMISNELSLDPAGSSVVRWPSKESNGGGEWFGRNQQPSALNRCSKHSEFLGNDPSLSRQRDVEWHRI